MSRKLIALLAVLLVAFAAHGGGAQAAEARKVLDVQTIRGSSGIETWLVEDHTTPVIAMNFSFDGGSVFDPDDKPGAGHLVALLLTAGAGDLKGPEFQAKLQENAISLSFMAGRDAFYGNLVTLTANRDLAAGLLKDALNKPRFDADAIERMKAVNAAEIKRDLADPAWLVARTFNGMLFEGHYYARPGFGTPDALNTLTRKDLTDFTAAQFGRSALKVSIAGDITKAQAEQLVESVFGSLPEKAESVERPDATMRYAGKIIMLPLDTPQTFIAAGEPGLKRTDKDWDAATVMNYILGGSNFDARLMKEIREKRGLTYGAYSQLTGMACGSVLQADMSASNEKVEEALRLLKESWAGMEKDGPTVEELQNAKSALIGSLPLELTSTADIAGMLNGLQRDGHDASYINRRDALISALTVDDIKRVAARLLKPEELAVVLVGQPKNINVDILLDKPPGMGPHPQR